MEIFTCLGVFYVEFVESSRVNTNSRLLGPWENEFGFNTKTQCHVTRPLIGPINGGMEMGHLFCFSVMKTLLVALCLVSFVVCTWTVVKKDDGTIALATSFTANNVGIVAGGSGSAQPLFL
jgi:hypothetical protein